MKIVYETSLTGRDESKNANVKRLSEFKNSYDFSTSKIEFQQNFLLVNILVRIIFWSVSNLTSNTFENPVLVNFLVRKKIE